MHCPCLEPRRFTRRWGPRGGTREELGEEDEEEEEEEEDSLLPCAPAASGGLAPARPEPAGTTRRNFPRGHGLPRAPSRGGRPQAARSPARS